MAVTNQQPQRDPAVEIFNTLFLWTRKAFDQVKELIYRNQETTEERLKNLQLEQNEILSKVDQNASIISQNTLLIENLDSEYSSLQMRVESVEEVSANLEELKLRVSAIETEIKSDDIKQLDFEARIAALESLDTNTKEKKEKKEKEKGKSEDAPGQNK